MTTIKKTMSFLNVAVWTLLGFANFALAQDTIKNPLSGVDSLDDLIVKIVKAALGLTAVVAVGFIVYGGFLYISAAGDAKQTEAGKTAIVGAVIGIIVIGVAFAIVQFVVGAIGGGGSGGGTFGVAP